MSGEPLRVAWVSIVTLLRAVGHTLKEVDAKRDPVILEVVNQKWDAWLDSKPEPRIFWEFIQAERNNVVKQYEFGFTRAYTLTRPKLGVAGLIVTADMLSVTGGPLPPQPFPELQSLIKEGPFRGRPEHEVAQEAADWWDAQLRDVEGQA